ncbi:MAG: class I SAM-dependent methyltransferase [Pseudomonadota bacterium]
MNFDNQAPFPVAEYRKYQHIVPGIDGLYDSMLAVFHHELVRNDPILVVGAGGGRELELLSRSERNFEVLGVDPSASMLELARGYIAQEAASRVKLFQGYVSDLDSSRKFAAATSVLVMHFLTDDGTKAEYLKSVRSKLRTGAPYIHVDVSIESDIEANNCGQVIAAHGQRIGAPEDIRNAPGQYAQDMRSVDKNCVVSPARNIELLKGSGFEIVSMFFRSLWFTGWWARAV